MATDKRENFEEENKGTLGDSGVFDIFFIENEDGEVVVTTDNPNKEDIEKAAEEVVSAKEDTAPEAVNENTDNAEPQEEAAQAEENEPESDSESSAEAAADETETADSKEEPAEESDASENVADAEKQEPDLDGDVFVEGSAADDEIEEIDENLGKVDDSEETENTQTEKAKTFTDPFESPLADIENTENTEKAEKAEKDAELFGEELDAEINFIREEKAANQAFVSDLDRIDDENSAKEDNTAFEKSADDAPIEKTETEDAKTPSALEKLKQGVEKANIKDRWKDSDASAKTNQKTVLGISYKVWALVIASIFTLDAILANVVCHWGIYYVVDKLLNLSGVAALKLEADSYRSFSIVISYVVAFILGGFLMFLLMNITKRLFSSVEFQEGTALIKAVMAILTVVFVIGTIVCLLTGHNFTTFVTLRFSLPMFMYLGAFIFYALSNVKFNQDY